MTTNYEWPDGSSVTTVHGVQIWHNGRGDFRHFGTPNALTAAAGAVMHAEQQIIGRCARRVLAQIDAMGKPVVRETRRRPSWSRRRQGGIW
ncbi:hypothetical protein ACIODS_04250 [Micromonospora chalcea]|uniref:hypothetical protein n=1 Tax=Micromonospora chalcea TaxID=1874 RepID=UPI0037FB6CF9